MIWCSRVAPFLSEEARFITFVLGQIGREMVRYMAEHKITDMKDIGSFDQLNFRFSEELSDENTYTIRGKLD